VLVISKRQKFKFSIISKIWILTFIIVDNIFGNHSFELIYQ
jgi:hypothetical protein